MPGGSLFSGILGSADTGPSGTCPDRTGILAGVAGRAPVDLLGIGKPFLVKYPFGPVNSSKPFNGLGSTPSAFLKKTL